MAISLKYGKCASCSRENPITDSVTSCRGCGAPLPWAKPPRPEISPAVRKPVAKPTLIGKTVVQGVGRLVTALGACLWLGNMTGVYPTFFGCGYLTMLVGFVIRQFAKSMNS